MEDLNQILFSPQYQPNYFDMAPPPPSVPIEIDNEVINTDGANTSDASNEIIISGDVVKDEAPNTEDDTLNSQNINDGSEIALKLVINSDGTLSPEAVFLKDGKMYTESGREIYSGDEVYITDPEAAKAVRLNNQETVSQEQPIAIEEQPSYSPAHELSNLPETGAKLVGAELTAAAGLIILGSTLRNFAKAKRR